MLLGSTLLPAWQASAVRSLLASKRISSVVRISIGSGSSSVTRVKADDSRLLQRVRSKVENPGTNRASDALQLEDVGALLGDFERPGLPPVSQHTHDSFAARDLDLIIAFADPALLPPGTPYPSLGVWHFTYQGRPLMPSDGSTIGYLEVLRREACLAFELRIRTDSDQRDRIALCTHSAVDPMSLYRTRNQHLWKCSTFILRVLMRVLGDGGREYLASLPDAEAARSSQLHPSGTVPLEPGSWPDLARYFLWRRGQRASRRKHLERWILLAGASQARPDPRQFRPILPPSGRFWADPHAVRKDGATYVFFEDASVQSGKGHIAVMRQEVDGRYSMPVTALERPYHLSYPFVFEWEGHHYMIPESAENRTIELYRCTRFPNQWRFEHNLMEGIMAYDATLARRDGRWWMFVNVAPHEFASDWDELCLFHGDSPVSRKWYSHPLNPVVSDVRRARPAGPLFLEGDRLFRPSQDSSGRYGRALTLNEVVTLTTDRYEERLVWRLEPDWNPDFVAVHSLSHSGGSTFMDAVLREPR